MPRALGVCCQPGCPHPAHTRGRCHTHAAQHEHQRGTRHQRGYGTEHERIRQHLLRQHIEGAPCIRCGQPMYRTQHLDAGHPDHNPARGGGKANRLEHATCNRSSAGAKTGEATECLDSE